MKSWKVLLGVGGACAICCALPIAATVTALFAGAGGGFALYTGSLFPIAGAVAVALLVVAGVWLRRSTATADAACACAAPSPTTVQGGCNAGRCS